MAGTTKGRARNVVFIVDDGIRHGRALRQRGDRRRLEESPVTTLPERAEQAGKSAGLVTTSHVTEAMHASFGLHVVDRWKLSPIDLESISRWEDFAGEGRDEDAHRHVGGAFSTSHRTPKGRRG